MSDTREYTIPARFERIRDLCGFVATAAEEFGFSTDEVFRIELACDEACTNVIQHSYGGENGNEIRVTLNSTPDSFIITIFDNGLPFSLNEVPEPNIPKDPDNIDELKIGGLGVHFMRSLMDEIHFYSENNHENKLVMIKYRPDRAEK